MKSSFQLLKICATWLEVASVRLPTAADLPRDDQRGVVKTFLRVQSKPLVNGSRKLPRRWRR